MSDLTTLRDHARTMAGKSDTPASEAALWFQIADEIDEYLTPTQPVAEDLFGEYADEPREVPS